MAAIRAMSGSSATLEFGRTLFPSPAAVEAKFPLSSHRREEGQGEGRTTPGISSGGKGLRCQAPPATLLAERFQVPRFPLGTPIGLRETDAFCRVLETISGRNLPEKHAAERGRLVDAYVDGHKYIFGKRAVVYGEEDLVIGLTAFLVEIGVQPVLCASGGRSGRLEEAIAAVTREFLPEPPVVREGSRLLRDRRDGPRGSHRIS